MHRSHVSRRRVRGGKALGPALVAAVLAACSATEARDGGSDDAGPTSLPDGGRDATPNDDPDPVVSDATRRVLEGLALSGPASPPPDVTNRFADDRAAAAFGQRLFFETRFAGRLLDGDNDGTAKALGMKGDTGKVACAGCHVPTDSFTDTRSLGTQIPLAAGWGLRHTPSILDVAQSRLILWDGRRDTLHGQVFGPIESALEMNSSRLFAAQQIFALHRTEYEAVFGAMPPLDDTARFPALTASETGCAALGSDNECTGLQIGAPGDGAQYDGMSAEDKDAVTRVIVNMGKAIGAYERLLSCGPSRFDRWILGEPDLLTREEQRGAVLFVEKGRCADCHSGPFFSDEEFHNVGLKPTVVATVFIDIDDEGAARGIAALVDDPLNARGIYSDGDDGRTPTAVEPSHLGAFRTPRLRCSEKRPSFMHTGQLRTLENVVSFFNRGGDELGYPGTSEITSLDLTERERADIVAFVLSLEGEGPPAELLSSP